MPILTPSINLTNLLFWPHHSPEDTASFAQAKMPSKWLQTQHMPQLTMEPHPSSSTRHTWQANSASNKAPLKQLQHQHTPQQPRPAPQTLRSGTDSGALAPSHQIILSRPRQSSQPSGLGTLHSQEHEQELQHNYNRRVHATYTGDIPRAPDSGEQGWLCHWAPQDTFYIRPLLQN